jgi:hypothetical protein
LDGLHKDDKIRLRLYESLLEGSILGGQMAGGGIGVAVPEELILMHAMLEMGTSADPNALRHFAPIFVDAVEKWREKAKSLCEGLEVPKQTPPIMPGKPGERFMKI